MVAKKRELSYTIWTFDWAAGFAQEVKKQLSFERKIISIYTQWHWLFQICFTVHFLYLSASSVLSALLLLFSWIESTLSLPLPLDFIERKMKGMPTLSAKWCWLWGLYPALGLSGIVIQNRDPVISQFKYGPVPTWTNILSFVVMV